MPQLDQGNLDNFPDLLETAYKNGNYPEAYRYATALLEKEPKDALWWTYKGLATAFLFDSGRPRLNEAANYIDKGIALASEGDLNPPHIATKYSYAVYIITNHLLAYFSGNTAAYAASHQTKTVVMPQKSISDSLGAGLAAGIADGLSEQSNWKKAAKENGKEFRKEHQSTIVNALTYSWTMDPSSDVAKNIFATLTQIIQATGLDSETKHALLNNAEEPLTSKIKAKFPQMELPEVPKDGCCFIATAVMGDYSHPYVVTLQELRDQKLQNSRLGRIFIAVYYRFSPPVAKFIVNRKWVRIALYHAVIKPSVYTATMLLDIEERA